MVTQNRSRRNLFSSAAALRIAAAVLQALIWLAASPAARADEYDGAIQRCEELLPEFDQHPQDIRREVRAATFDQPVAVRISWQRSDAQPGRSEEHTSEL